MFPCKECLVRLTCSELCNKVCQRNRSGTIELLSKNICPDCGTNNKFNVRQSFIEYRVNCSGWNHLFVMYGYTFKERVIKWQLGYTMMNL